jgi:cyanate permease
LTLSQALRHRAFHILAASNAVWAMAGTGVIFYLYTICADRGLERTVASDLFKTFGLSMLAMQLIGGVLADFLPLNRLLGFATLVLSAGLGLVVVADTEAALHGFAGLFGGGQGLLLAVGACIWVRYFGRAHLGSIRGAVWCATVAGSGCGPLILGVTRDQTGGFEPALCAFFVTMCILALATWWATPPSRSPSA